MPRSRFALVLVVLAMLLAATASHAATLAKGTFELEPSGQFSHQSFSFNGNGAGTQTNLTLQALLGYSTTDMLELVASPVVTHSSSDDPTFGTLSATAFGLLAGVRFNFSVEGNVVPFVGAALGVEKFSGDLGGDETAFIAPSIEAGLRLMLGNKAAAVFAADYQHQTSAVGVKDLSANDFALSVGVSLFPGRTP
jgi:hypothetical protein